MVALLLIAAMASIKVPQIVIEQQGLDVSPHHAVLPILALFVLFAFVRPRRTLSGFLGATAEREAKTNLIGSAIVSRTDRALFCQRFASVILERGYLLVVVRERLGFLERLFRPKGEIRIRGARVSSFKGAEERGSAAKFLTKCVWHKPYSHFLILGAGMTRARLEALLVARPTVGELEAALASDLVLYVDPVDDELFFYGDASEETFLKTLMGIARKWLRPVHEQSWNPCHQAQSIHRRFEAEIL